MDIVSYGAWWPLYNLRRIILIEYHRILEYHSIYSWCAKNWRNVVSCYICWFSYIRKQQSWLEFYHLWLKNYKAIVRPLYKSKYQANKNIIQLLYLKNESKAHYVLVKDLSRFVGSQSTTHHEKLYFWDTCLVFFTTCKKPNNHVWGRERLFNSNNTNETKTFSS